MVILPLILITVDKIKIGVKHVLLRINVHCEFTLKKVSFPKPFNALISIVMPTFSSKL